MSVAKILVVDDEEDILDLLQYNLEKENFLVLRAMNGEEALKVFQEYKPDMILLDIMMPMMDGVETCRRIREMSGGNSVYVVFLTARSEEYSEIAGLEAGADDYITKPIKPRLLITRIQTIFRRGNRQGVSFEESDKIEVGDFVIDKSEYTVYMKGKPLSLPKKEFELLLFLASQPGKVFKRETLLEMVWGSDVHVVDRTIDVHIRKLREKIGKKWIVTVQGVGYKFSTD